MAIEEPTILIVDDEDSVRQSMSMSLESAYHVITCEKGEECLELVRDNDIDLILLDLRMPGLSGEETLEGIKQIDSNSSVIVVSAYADVNSAVQCMKLGAYDIMTKPVDLIQLESVIRNILSERGLTREVQILREELRQFRQVDNLIYKSSKMAEVIRRSKKVAKLQTDCLLIGETGTGKEIISDLIHKNGPRAEKPFIVVDCASLTQSLAASILFGHEKGAFTGAVNRKMGKFEMAQGGVVFLDEIAHLPKEIQPFLLRVLENRSIQRVGSNNNIKLDVQIIAATNRDLRKLIDQKEFVPDLFYRLMTVPIEIPSLKERVEDIAILAYHFLQIFQKKYSCRMKQIDSSAIEALEEYSWPGNVRELRYIIEHIMVIYGSEETLSFHHLPSEITDRTLQNIPIHQNSELEKVIQEIERRYIVNSLERYSGNISQSAKELGLGRNTLYRKIKAYDIDLAKILKV